MTDFQPKPPRYPDDFPPPKPLPTPEQLSHAVMTIKQAVQWGLFITIVNFLMLAYDTDFIYHINEFVSKL